MKIVFATNNLNKLAEIRQLMPEEIEILGLKDINCLEELPETSDTLEDNAAQKSFYVFDNYGHNCFADDTGLEIDALDGRPEFILLVMQDQNVRQKITSKNFGRDERKDE